MVGQWSVDTEDHALFVGIFASIGVSPADAQQTPTSYCKTLQATSCEVLNIDLGGVASGYGVGLVKYCRNQQFMIAPLLVQQILTGQPAVNLGLSGTYNNVASTYPQSAISGTSLCSLLP